MAAITKPMIDELGLTSPQAVFDKAAAVARSGEGPANVKCSRCDAVKSGLGFLFPNGTTFPCSFDPFSWQLAAISQDVSFAYARYPNDAVKLEAELQRIAKKHGVEYVPPKASAEATREERKFTLTYSEDSAQATLRVFALG